jgi:hypothetical protein
VNAPHEELKSINRLIEIQIAIEDLQRREALPGD